MTIYEARALAAYLRSGTTGQITAQTIEIATKSYVVLSSGEGILAVYRIKPAGKVRRLVRYPLALARMV